MRGLGGRKFWHEKRDRRKAVPEEDSWLLMADALTEAVGVVVPTVGDVVVAVESLDGAALHGAQGPAGAVAEAAQVVVAAAADAVVVVPPLNGAAVHGA